MAALRDLWSEYRLTIIVLAVLVGAYLLLRTAPSDVPSAEAFGEIVRSNRATVAYLYSNT